MRNDATFLAQAIRKGRLSAVEAMQASLMQAERQADLGAIVVLDRDLGLKAARDMDERMTAPDPDSMPFAGVPSLGKDLGGPFSGLPVAAGSSMLDRAMEQAGDSDLALRLRASGLCFFGLTTVPEMGLSLASEPATGPICRNPLDPQLTAGGSSGGAAAAVAAGIVAIAHATDAGGSIRVPAACCGLVGLKASRGVMPAGPTFGNHLGGIASELAVCRSVRDLASLFQVAGGLARGPFADPRMLAAASGKLRVGLLTDCGCDFAIDPHRAAAVEAAARALEAEGHAIVQVPWDRLQKSVAASGDVLGDIIAVNLANYVDAAGLVPERAEPLTQAFVRRGRAMTGQSLWASLDAGVHASRALWEMFGGVDCLLTPMLSGAPLPLGSFPTDHDDPDLQLARMAAFAPLASLANISGFPAITLPFGADATGLPLPVQIMAPMGNDLLLLALAARLEAEDRWQHRFPVAGLTP
ncbi:amidase [Pararhizobium antarcticum]|uniref:Indoleacetamide hydrolase n=1 Tax=Pararhizobium antarcticum TaxID=1798805 RepID=A0A657LR47_9HYPH|nr:amidase [Pararhizobium antarcticum]OJF95858.1 amidase [Pararhizobium antarcticum]OJF99301.1 amidase [Rhizobium sp. 58]